MLKKQFLIKKDKINLIFKKARTVGSRYFYIRYLPNQEQFSQFGIIISKKTQKLAVDRNYSRRIIKKWIFENLKNIKKGYFFLITLKSPIEKNDQQEIMCKNFLELIQNI